MADKIRALRSFFTTVTRDDKSVAVILTDDRPEWLHDAIHGVHGSDLPNDWIFSECRDACSAIDDGSLTDDDSVHEYADGAVEIYTAKVYQWAADMCQTDLYSDAESEADDMGPTEGTEKRIQVVQYCALSTIARAMMAAHDDASEASDDDDDA